MKNSLHGLGFADEAGRGRGRRRTQDSSPLLRQDGFNGIEQLLFGKGLGQIILGAQPHGLDRPADGWVSGHHEDADRLVVGADVADQVQAADPRHSHVGNHQIKGRVLHQTRGFCGARGGHNGVSCLREMPFDQLERIRRVVDNQDLTGSDG